MDLNNIEFCQKLYIDKVDGEVWKVYDLQKKEYIHVKMISLKPEIDIEEERKLEDLEIELKIYNQIKRDQHPNICDLRGVSDTLFDDTDRVIYLKTEGGLCCLHDMLETRVNGLSEDTDFPYTEKEIMMIARQVSEHISSNYVINISLGLKLEIVFNLYLLRRDVFRPIKPFKRL